MTAPTSFPSATVRTNRGDEYQIRPIHPDDKRVLADAFTRLSPQTRYNRFLVPADRLSNTQLAYLTELDFHDHVAWGLLDGDEPVSVARFIRLAEDPTSADFAVTVFDSHQGRGIGPLMIEILAVSARARGISRFQFDVLAENRPMLTVLDRMGADFTDEPGDIVHATMEIRSIPGPEVVSGDLGELLESAARLSGQSRVLSSNDAELTQ